MVGIVTIRLILVLEKTRLGALGMVVAIAVASMLVPLAGWDAVGQVNEIAEIPSSLPLPQLPPLSVIPALIIPAISLAFVGLVQGAGVTKNYVNPDGKYPDASGDFVGQGAANIFSGLFQGTPVGGSISGSALVTSGGAKSRFGNIFAGITMAAVILLFGQLIGFLALPAMAGLLMVVGFRALKLDKVEVVWKTGLVGQVVMVITFGLCMFVPLQYAVLIGVGISVLLYFFQESHHIKVKEWDWEPGQYPVEQDVPETVPSNEVTLVMVYGSVFFATASLIEEKLPEITEDTQNAVIILGLRGEDDLGSTFLEVLDQYATDLQAHNSQFMLAGVGKHTVEQLNQTKIAKTIGRENIFAYTGKLGEAATLAWDAGHKWLGEQTDPQTSYGFPGESNY